MMFETTQPEVVETANQPDTAAETEDAMPDGANEPFLTVRYNKEDKVLDEETARTYAQKGMNYDKLSERLETANAQLAEYEEGSLNQLVRDYAAQSGASYEEINEMLQEQLGMGLDEDAAKQAVIDAQLMDFMARNPEVDPRGLPGDVLDAWSAGVPLGEAAAGHAAQKQIGVLQQQISEIQANAENAAASMGKPQSRGEAHEKPLSVETIRNMSEKELKKNHERIWEYLTGQKRDKR